MKRLILILLAVIILSGGTVLAYENPFNNNLFTVVGEASVPGGMININFTGVRLVPSADAKSYKAVYHSIDYNGRLTEKDLCDFTTIEEASDILNSYEKKPPVSSFNDGLELFYGGGNIYEFKNIEKQTVHSVTKKETESYSYNMGLINFGNNEETTFTKALTTGEKYSFHAKINPFNNNGYSLMNKDGVYYVVKLKSGIIPTVLYNGEKIAFDVVPIIENGRTLVPLRAIFEAFGAAVSWDQKTKTVTSVKNGTTIILKIGDTTAYKNKKAINLDVPAKVENGRTLVPVRFIADCFDINVEWNQKLLQVVLNDK